ncbi:hypothetical protein H5410_016077 [Solanum commersonii]|uniref:Uncharacterized protein n=1 Tax=Solanum commersonii TaxID=4109 RepID=A0A9J5ZV92_SOLCO|nr:hypothetical protein H5410_016077 [Solanum commersonii]
MKAVILDQFNGTGNPEGWLYRAERYFAFLGFAEEYWVPLPSFYLKGEALTWFDWLFHNKQFFDWMHFKEKFIQRFSHQTKVYPVVQTTVPSNFQTSFTFKSAYETQTLKEDHVFDKLPEQYHAADPCEFTNRGITGIRTVDDIITPRNGRSKSTTALVQKSSVVAKDTVFVEMSYTTMNPNLHDPNASVHDEEHSAFVITAASDTSICRNANEPQVLDESSHNIKFGEIRSIASQVSLLITFEAPEVVRSNEHLERDVSTRYVNVNSLASGSPIWKTDLESFEDYLMHSVKILPYIENGKSTWEFNGQHILSQFYWFMLLISLL